MHAKPVYDTLVCFGDSLTQQASAGEGFVGRLQDAYQRKLDVVSRGFSGYTSRQGLALCPILFEKSQEGSSAGPSNGTARLATVWFGTNDSVAEDCSQHVPIDEYEANMRRILSQYFDDVEAVLLLTPATVVPGRFEGHMDDKSMVEYGARLKKIAKEYNEERSTSGKAGGLAVVDMNVLFLEAGKRLGGLESLFQEDGLHIAAPGYDVVYNGIAAAIKEHFPHLLPDALEPVFPLWRDLDLSADEQGQAVQLQPRRQDRKQ